MTIATSGFHLFRLDKTDDLTYWDAVEVIGSIPVAPVILKIKVSPAGTLTRESVSFT
jgi:hypothetical protein